MCALKLIIPLVAVLAYAQSGNKASTPVIEVGQRVALVIGNGAYRFQPQIPQAINDADDMTARLRALKFQVTLLKDTRIGDLDRQLDTFYQSIHPGSLALFYYSGHGGSLGEENYILPIEYQQQETESGVGRNAVSVSKIRDQMESRGATVRVLVFDACRSASLVAAKDGSAGLAAMHGKAEGTLVAYASANGQVSRFNPSARNSYYTAALLERLGRPNADLSTMLNETADDVYVQTGQSQMPYLYGRLFGKLYLAGIPTATTPEPVNVEEDLYNAVKDSNNPASLEDAAAKMDDPARAAALRARAKALLAMPAGGGAPKSKIGGLEISRMAGLHPGDTYEVAIKLFGNPTALTEDQVMFGTLDKNLASIHKTSTNFRITFDPATHQIKDVLALDTEVPMITRIAGTDPVLGLFGKSKQEAVQLLGPPQQQQDVPRTKIEFLLWSNGPYKLNVAVSAGKIKTVQLHWIED